MPPDSSAHPVEVAPNSLLSGIFSADHLQVNSFHHQAVTELGSNLSVTAVSPDGIIEGVEYRGHPFCLAVQWHPEVAVGNQAGMEILFQKFIMAARAMKHS
jgi:putative glutamine amidotransferase